MEEPDEHSRDTELLLDVSNELTDALGNLEERIARESNPMLKRTLKDLRDDLSDVRDRAHTLSARAALNDAGCCAHCSEPLVHSDDPRIVKVRNIGGFEYHEDCALECL